MDVQYLCNFQEEADTNTILHSLDTIQRGATVSVLVTHLTLTCLSLHFALTTKGAKTHKLEDSLNKLLQEKEQTVSSISMLALSSWLGSFMSLHVLASCRASTVTSTSFADIGVIEKWDIHSS